jgi:hypothetical protein
MRFHALILAEVRRKIADDSQTYICLALDEIAQADHRRGVQQACAALKQRTLDQIAPFKTVGDWLAHHAEPTTMQDVKQARLALLDCLANPRKDAA